MGLIYSLEINQETYEGFVSKNYWNTFVLVVKFELFLDITQCSTYKLVCILSRKLEIFVKTQFRPNINTLLFGLEYISNSNVYKP